MNHQKVLIVDDDGPILKALNIRFQHSGFEVLCARDPISALGVVQQERPDAAILDINLPGVDGFELSRKIRATADIPIFFMTANKIGGLKEKARDCNGVSFFEKPFDSRTLIDEVKGCLTRLNRTLM